MKQVFQQFPGDVAFCKIPAPDLRPKALVQIAGPFIATNIEPIAVGRHNRLVSPFVNFDIPQLYNAVDDKSLHMEL
jgi:hypothetical protein